MPPDNNIAFPTQSDEQGFADAVSLFAKDDVPQPAPTPAPAPTPVPEVPQEAATEEPEKAPDEDVYNKDTEKTPEEQGKSPALIALEKEIDSLRRERTKERQRADYWMQNYQKLPVPEPPKAPVAEAPQQFNEPKPKLADFETADQWADARDAWIERRAIAVTESRFQQREVDRQQQESVSQYNNFINGKIAEAQKKVGLSEFNEAARDIVDFAPHGSQMYNTLFDLEHFPEVVMHLSKNISQAEKIASLRPFDQVYELKALEKKLVLAAKQPPKLPTKVEAPGNGHDQKPELSVPKLRAAAKSSGQVKDWAKVFQADPTM